MISQSTRHNIKFTFEKLQEAYDHLKIDGVKDYFLTLGNINEVHLIKKDATKSIFLGKLFLDENSTKEVEARKIWNAIQDYFMSTSTSIKTSIETKVEDVPVKKTTRKSKKVEEVKKPEPIAEEPDVEEDDESSWVDTIL